MTNLTDALKVSWAFSGLPMNHIKRGPMHPDVDGAALTCDLTTAQQT